MSVHNKSCHYEHALLNSCHEYESSAEHGLLVGFSEEAGKSRRSGAADLFGIDHDVNFRLIPTQAWTLGLWDYQGPPFFTESVNLLRSGSSPFL